MRCFPKKPWIISWRRWLAKTLLFSMITAVVLNPNLKRAWMQIRHTLHPEALIQTSFPGLPEIQAQLDRGLANSPRNLSEPRMIARWVLRKITYVSDYENWGNVDYWPSAAEVWAKRQEDCDGRAVLAASLLRSRGYRSARLVVGLDHMWVKVDENEKSPSKPPHFIALLSTRGTFSLELKDRSSLEELRRWLRELFSPRNLQEMISEFFAGIPVERKVILVSIGLSLVFYPSRQRPGFLAVQTLGLGAVAVLADWEPASGHAWQGAAGCCLLLGAISAALFLDRLWERRRQERGSRDQPIFCIRESSETSLGASSN